MTKKRLLILALILVVAAAAVVVWLVTRGPGKEYTITLNSGIPGGVAAQEIKAYSGRKITVAEAPVREGYVLDGWYTDANLTEAWNMDEQTVASDMTLYAAWDKDTGDAVQNVTNDKDFSKMRTPGSQEEAYAYKAFFLPAIDGISQPYVGDTMPYYEDGVYYIYYLKEAGDSYNHSVYLATTEDFLTYKEYDEPIIEASRSGGQDAWVGTGSVVKVGEQYYFFYTGHNNSATQAEAERILVAVGDSPFRFEKKPEWCIKPDNSLGQKQDFRDPQAYLDPETGNIILTVTASQSNVARILKYTVTPSLAGVSYDGIIFSNPVGNFWNLECSDTFRIGDTWYITYSAQDDTLWYASSDTPYGPYGAPTRLDAKLFYAAKHVEDGKNVYMVGWARRSESPSSTEDVMAWGGNLIVQKLVQREDKTLALLPVDALANSYSVRRALAADASHIYLNAGGEFAFADAFTCYESFKLSGSFTFTGTGSFGLSFDFMNQANKKKLIMISPEKGTLSLAFNEGRTPITETAVSLTPGETYSFTYIQEGSVGTFYIDDLAALTVRIYGASGKTIQLFAENNAVQFTSLREYTQP
ncbi:MAG: InlB B-repeat-containing protein [Clostridia bacterium]|nr:InlB B-repeat-containing protein [Clostridia bacterium]